MAEHGDLTDECKDTEEGRDPEEHEECNGNVIVGHVLLVFVVFKLGPSEPNNVEDGDQQCNGENNGSADNRSKLVCELNVTWLALRTYKQISRPPATARADTIKS
jgi:hypothetical protein